MDVGQPKDFLSGTTLLLEHFRKHSAVALSKGENIIGNVLIVFSSAIAPPARTKARRSISPA